MRREVSSRSSSRVAYKDATTRGETRRAGPQRFEHDAELLSLRRSIGSKADVILALSLVGRIGQEP